jgi:hypothetical protein
VKKKFIIARNFSIFNIEQSQLYIYKYRAQENVKYTHTHRPPLRTFPMSSPSFRAEKEEGGPTKSVTSSLLHVAVIECNARDRRLMAVVLPHHIARS